MTEFPTETTDGLLPAEPAPSWWHRDHPTFTPIAGFFTGLLFVVFVPGAFATILRLFFHYETARGLYPFVVLTLALPFALLISARTRRFGLYMLLGTLATIAVVIGVGALVLWLMVMIEG